MTIGHYGTATYDPRDNKLRIYAFSRLPREVYERFVANGFHWAPKQELFVASMWTPEREDFALEMCGDIEDESTTPEERAADRADRFDGYHANRLRDAARAVAAVEAIQEGIPLGQPILVGHHSERHARRDARRIESGTRKAIENWGKAEYWKARAPAVLAHAECREAPGVRSRRIKGLAADLRKMEKRIEESEEVTKLWEKVRDGVSFLKSKETGESMPLATCVLWMVGRFWDAGVEKEEAETLAPDEAARKAIEKRRAEIARPQRWAEHYRNRIAFETAALALEEGRDPDAPAPAEVDYKVGGSVVTRAGGRYRWSGANDGEPTRRRILRVTKRNGAAISLVLEGLRDAVAVEACADYQEPTAEDVEAAKKRTALPPICNYPDGAEHWTAEEWSKKPSDYKTVKPVKATDTHGAHRRRFALSKAGGFALVAVYITDQKRTDPPTLATVAEVYA